MKKHTKIYLDAMGYDTNSWIPCEVCQATAVDIHHIEARGMGGSNNRDTIDNLMALCRQCHNEYGDLKQHKEMLKARHNYQLSKRVI
jgi:5-methylcytosine-specific restriction endonuclease McrA